jgi:hypothetical protein
MCCFCELTRPILSKSLNGTRNRSCCLVAYLIHLCRREHLRVLRHNGGFYNTCTLKRCLHRKVDFKTNATYNAYVSQVFPLQSKIVKKGLYYFKLIKTNSLNLDAVTKKCLLNFILNR